MKIYDESIKPFGVVLTLTIALIIIISSSAITAVQGPEISGQSRSDNIETEDKSQKNTSSNLKLKEKSMISSKEEGIFLNVIDSSEDVGKFPSIKGKKIDGEEHMYVSYHSEDTGNLKIAHNNIDDTENGWMTWDLGGKVGDGVYSSLEISDGLEAHLTFYDPEEGNLNYATWCIDNNQFKDIQTEVIDHGDVGQYCSLELSDDGKPKVSYFDGSNGVLKYAEKDSYEGWEIQKVDSSGTTVGKYTSLALDEHSKPHISYYDWDNRDLKYAYWSDNLEGWSTQTIEIEEMYAGKYTSIEVSEDDSIHISCHGWTNDDDNLIYASYTEMNGWNKEIISESEPTGTYSSLELSDNEKPIISYHEWGEENLKFASKDSGSWKTAEVDTASRVGSHTSLHHSGEAEVHIGYHDQGEGGLKHARYFFKNRTPLAPQSFQTYSEYGEIILEWDNPIYDGIKTEGDHILGYHVYRRSKGKEEFEKIANVTTLSYTDDIERENETETYEYRVAAVNRKGVGDNTSIIQTKGRYFSYEREAGKTNSYSIDDEVLPLNEGENPGTYDIRWDLDYNSSEQLEWDSVNQRDEVSKYYPEIGLKSVMLEYENSEGDKRRCFQSAWVLGKFRLTSSYEEYGNGSDEIFFHLPKDKTEYDVIDEEDALKNTYILKTEDELPYEEIEFVFDKAEEEERETVAMSNSSSGGMIVWRNTFDVSDSKGDGEVRVIPYLYNKHRDGKESPLDSYHDLALKNKREVEVINTPGWFPYMLDLFLGDNVAINNTKEDEEFVGWAVEFERPELNEDTNDSDIKDGLEKMNISAAPELDILDDLKKFFGGDYGFEIELFPDDKITFDNDLDFETTLIKFQTAVDEEDRGINDFEGQLGNSYNYAAEQEMEVSAGVSVDLIVKEEGISVSGALTLDVAAGIKIDIPLQSIGFAEVGLTAEVGGEIGVEYEIGALEYVDDKGLSLDPGSGEVPIEFVLSFGGGPYGEVGAGLAKVEGKLILDAIMNMVIPSLDSSINHEGRFKLEVSAGWGLWSKTKEWELYSTTDSTSMTIKDTNDSVENQVFITDRLSTRDYGIDEKISENATNGFEQKRNVGPRADPEIVSIDENNALAVWSELSRDEEGEVVSELHYQKFSDGRWEDRSHLIETEGNMSYAPELLVMGDNVAMIHKEIEEKPEGLSTVEELEDYYTNDTLKGKLWDGTGWSDLGLQHSVEGQAISSFDLALNDQNDIHIVYRSGRPSLDMFDSPPSEEANISVLKQDGTSWTKILEREENLPQTSRPSIEFVGGDGAIVYTRIVENGEVINRTVLKPLTGDSEEIVVETSNTTSHNLLSEKDGDMVVTWVENHTTIRRKVIGENWNIPGTSTTVNSNETVSGLSHHVNGTGEYYVFQKDKEAVPTVIESSGQAWGKERNVLDDNTYQSNEVSADFGLDEPTMLLVEENDLIDSWHRVHHRFDDSLPGGNVEDESGSGNIGKLRGNWSKELHETLNDHDRGGHYLRFEGEDSKMVIDHSSSLNVTEETEEFSVTALLDAENYGNQSYLMRKEGSWSAGLNDGNLELEIWDENGSHTVSTGMMIPSGWSFFALRYEESWLNVTLKGYDEKGDLTDHTENIFLDDFDSLASSTEPILISEGPGVLCIDDFRLVGRYLPDVSLEKINRTAYPSFDVEYSVTTKKVPPYVNFTCSNTSIVGERTSFTAQSPRSGLNYTWSFEDGVEKYGKKIEHTFRETGYHTVTLEAEDEQSGAKTRIEKTLHVIDVNPPRFYSNPQVVERYGENNSVKISWEEAKGESQPFEYRIHHNVTDPDVKEVIFDHKHWKKSTEKTSIVLEGLNPTRRHNIDVSVVNDVGLTNKSAETLSFQIEDDLPPRFDGLRSTYVVNNTGKEVGLVWDEAEDHVEPISYNVYHSRDQNISFEDPLVTTLQTDIRIQVSEIEEHYFAVRAEDGEGNEDGNEVVKSVEIEGTLSPDIQIINPTDGNTLRHDVTLTWSVPEPAIIAKYWVKSDHYKTWLELDKGVSNYTFEFLPLGERTLKVMTEDVYGNKKKDRVNITIRPYYEPEIISRSPSDGAEKVDTDAELEIGLDTAVKEEMTVSFFDTDGNLIGREENVGNDELVSVVWTGLEHGTTYRWYVRICQDDKTMSTETWEFETLDLFSLNVDVEGNGSVEPSAGTHTYEEGKNVELQAYPDEGWKFSSWSGDKAADEEKIPLLMDENKQITAHFERIEIDEDTEYEIDVSVIGEGDIIGIETGTHTFAEGENVSLKADPDDGWCFDRWSGDIESEQERINITMDENQSLTAHFEEEEEGTEDTGDSDQETGQENDKSETIIGQLKALDVVLVVLLVGLAAAVIVIQKIEND